MEIEKIQEEIAELFRKYKIPALTHNLPMENLNQWAFKVARYFILGEEGFRDSVTELFWSVSHVQLSLGYALIARQSCKFPKGTQGEAFREEDIPNMIGMPEMHFWLHIYSCYECIYRCWERITMILQGACFPRCSRKKYFNQIVNDLCKDSKYKHNKSLKELKKQVKNWSKIAEIRNGLSHGKSSPFQNTIIKGTLSDTVGLDGLPIPKLIYSSKNLIQETKDVVEKYRNVLPAIKVMKEFIDNIDN